MARNGNSGASEPLILGVNAGDPMLGMETTCARRTAP